MKSKNNKIRHFVITFDSNYLPKAIVCYLSLSKYHRNFFFHAFCFDKVSFCVLKKLNYKNFIAYKQSDFENEELISAKKKKVKLYEYYWSCKPFLIRKVMLEQKADIVTYIDADFMFFDSPECIFDEMGDADVLIQPNNFSFEEVKQFIPVGYYCTCWESFRNTRNGRRILNWWHKKDMEWCLAEFKPGLFADQKYLDDWRIRFRNVRENSIVGANVAPWNIQKYDLSNREGKVYVNIWPVIYYHYHGFRMNIVDYEYIITGDRENYYTISKEAIEYIYKPYITELKTIIKMLKKFKGYEKYVQQNPFSQVHLLSKNAEPKFASYK